MEDILKELHLESLIPHFLAERIEPANVAALSDEELCRVGVTTIGDRLRLRDLCAVAEKDRTRESVASNVLQERMALFNGRNSRRADRKKKAVAKRSWTVSFVCVADRHQSKIPTSTEKQVLFQAGLGVKKIKLDLEDDEQSVLEKITCGDKGDDGELKGFPQLKECGGLEIMYCISGCKELKPLNCCWSAKELKSNVGSQSKLYVRPIQKSLSTVSIVPQNKSKVKEKCNICNKEVLMKDLRYHVLMCKTKEGLVSSDSDDEGLSSPAFSAWRMTESTTSEQQGQYQNPNNPGSSSLPGNLAAPTTTPVVNLVDDLINPAFHPGRIPESTTEQQRQHQNPNDSGSSSGDLTVPAAVVNPDDGDDNQVDEVNNAALSVDDIVDKVVGYCIAHNIHNPVEILRCLQKDLVIGQPLEITDITQCKSGQTNFIIVNRDKLLSTAFDELDSYDDFRLTLEVQFYDELAEDYGGPRKEFFRLALSEIKQTFFDQGIREHLSEDYLMVGLIMGLSVVQNGKIPKFLGEEMLVEIFQKPEATLSPSLANLRKGLQKTGIFQICDAMPEFLYLFRQEECVLTMKMLTTLLKPSFSETGSNKRRFENEVYAAFTKYLREVASGRRGGLSLCHVLQFVTGADEEPALGFENHPSLIFTELKNSFLPTAHACSNTLHLPHATTSTPLIEIESLFQLYDYAFVNAYFGKV